MKNLTKLAAVAFLVLAPQAAFAGRGGSAKLIQAAVDTRSTTAIIAEVERSEKLLCADCIDVMTKLTEDSRYEVREVAAWWFAKRPALKDMLASQFVGELPTGSTVQVRNAADFLGRTKTYTALPQLRSAIHRGDIGPEAKVALVRAAAYLAHVDGNEVLTTAMTDGDAGVRAAAAGAWREVLGQRNAQPVVSLLGDADANVRAQAAATIGGMTEQTGRLALEALVVGDADPVVRRNAAWALGQLGKAASAAALLQATTDKSGLVRGVAKASLANLR